MSPWQSFSARIRRAAALVDAVLFNAPKRKGVSVTYVKPCYWVVDDFKVDSVIIDVGLGFDADFSLNMLSRFPVRSVGFDPTAKHAPALRKTAAESSGRFTYIEAAIGTENGFTDFFESSKHVSGSLLDAHPNISSDDCRRYTVATLTLENILRYAGAAASLVKLDVEGTEYAVLDAIGEDVLRFSRQWVIEFHHGVVPPFSFADTSRIIRKFQSCGFSAYTRDGVNYLFYTAASTP